MNYLFWNTYKKQKINHIIVEIILKNKCDIIGLAEYEDDIKELINELAKKGIYMYEVPRIGSRLTILTKFIPGKVTHLQETSYYTLKLVPHEKMGNHIIAFVHLSSKRGKPNPLDHTVQISNLRMAIEEEEETCKNTNTIIMGDFNIDPFEQGMISAIGCHSLSARDVVKKKSRKIEGIEYKMFYNPMWNLYGDYNYPPGTYYYRQSIQENYFWHMFDQVIIRPELIEKFDFSKLEILTEINTTKLISRNKIPRISDHLPIIFTIN